MMGESKAARAGRRDGTYVLPSAGAVAEREHLACTERLASVCEADGDVVFYRYDQSAASAAWLGIARSSHTCRVWEEVDCRLEREAGFTCAAGNHMSKFGFLSRTPCTP